MSAEREWSDLVGQIQVYREFIPRKNAIEYTAYWKTDGKKYRTDVLVREGQDARTEIENAIRRGHYAEASKDFFEKSRGWYRRWNS